MIPKLYYSHSLRKDFSRFLLYNSGLLHHLLYTNETLNLQYEKDALAND